LSGRAGSTATSAALSCGETERFNVSKWLAELPPAPPFGATEIGLPARSQHAELTYVKSSNKVTYMVKTQVYLRKEELDALRMAAARSGRSVAALVRDAIRKIVLNPQAAGPVAIWDGEPKRTSIEHDSVHDER
jgi:Ribbon-helix-helix protein, copG family